MTIRVRFWSYFKELAGCGDWLAELPAEATLGELRDRVMANFPQLQKAQRSTLAAVGWEYQTSDYRLKEGDEVSFFPPVQGG